MQLTEKDVLKRLPVWRAISAFWVDEEVSIPNIADALGKSGFTTEELDRMFHSEIVPAFAPICLVPMPGLAPYEREWLIKRIRKFASPRSALARYNPIRLGLDFLCRRMVGPDWDLVLARLKSPKRPAA